MEGSAFCGHIGKMKQKIAFPIGILASLALFGLLWAGPSEARQAQNLDRSGLALGSENDAAWQEAQALIPQSAAIAVALRVYPGSKPIAVQLLPGARPVYAVKLRTQGQVVRVLVDAQSAQMVGN